MASLQVNRVRNAMLWLPWLGLAVQILICSQPRNAFCALMAAFSAWLLLFDSFTDARWTIYPLSSFALFGIAIVKSIGPLFFTAFEGHALIYNLMAPVRLFAHLNVLVLVVLFSHWLYRKQLWLAQLRSRTAQMLGFLLAVDQPLSRGAVMVLVSMGCLGSVAAVLLDPGGLEQPLPVKVAEGFILLTSVLVVLVCRPLVEDRSRGLQPVDLQLFAFGLVTLLLISFAVNSRSVFAVPLLNLGLALLLSVLFGLIRLRIQVLLPGVLALLLAMPLLTDLATSIVLIRNYRGDVEPAELVSLTLEQLGRHNELSERRSEDREAGLNDWDEVYLDNVFLARFCNLKFDDNALMLQQQLTPVARQLMREYYFDRLVATAPRNLLALFGIDNDAKLAINGRSFGDELYALSTGERFARGGFRTGHFIGTDWAVFGWWSLPLLVVVLQFLFTMADALQARPIGHRVFNPLVVTQLVPLLTLANAESLVSLLQLILRGMPQVVLTYALTAWIGRHLLPDRQR